MQENKIKHVSIELKIIKLDLDRISSKLEDNNRTIKEILRKGDISTRALDLKEMIEFNRFLLQKHKEKISDKIAFEDSLNKYIQEENKVELELIEDEKRMECFILTVNENLEFNESHPYYKDIEFITDLLNE